MFPSAERALIRETLGSDIVATRPCTGGDINQAHQLDLADGRTVFAKTNPGAPADMFAAEAHGLGWLAETGALRTPVVLGHSNPDHKHQWLLLEWIQSGHRSPQHDEALGHGLAQMHQAPCPHFGLDRDNHIGALAQANPASETWPAFYGQSRLAAQFDLARNAGQTTLQMQRDMDAVLARLPDLVGPAEPPARVHGDLWGGNAMTDHNGAPVLIDPAVYGGHREVDLAMMKLFGGFSERVFSAYEEAHPLAPGYTRRLSLYQLYPLLVHLNLFGSSYRGSVQRCLTELL